MRLSRPAPVLAVTLAVLGAALPTATASADATASAAAPAPPTGRLLVTMKAGAAGSTRTARAAGATLGGTGTEVAGPVDPRLRLMTVRPVRGTDPHRAAQALRSIPGVRSVEVEHRAQLRYVPNDPALLAPETAPGTPGGITMQWWAAGENLPAMWDLAGGSGATVAVIDTGADARHPELASKIAGTIDNDPSSTTGPADTDQVGHGTHVASIACAASNNGIGIAGAGLNCKLLIIKSDLSDASIATSIRQAVDAGADAINMSFGTDGRQAAATPIVSAIDYAVSKGVILVAAAADEPTAEQGDPSNVLQPSGSGADITKGKGLSVTSASFTGQRSPFAGYGSQISIAAYGSFATNGGPTGIFAAFPAGSVELERPSFTSLGCGCRTSFAGDNRYAYIQGTSMAAPMVSAVAADVRHLNPDLSAPALIRILKQTASRPAGTGWTADLGWGIVNGGAAAAKAKTVDARPPRTSIKTTTQKVVNGNTVTLRFNHIDKGPAGVYVAGYRSLQVWRSTNGGRAVRIATTSKSSLKVSVRRGSRYTFYTRGLDKAGNREAPPARPDVTVRATDH